MTPAQEFTKLHQQKTRRFVKFGERQDDRNCTAHSAVGWSHPRGQSERQRSARCSTADYGSRLQ